MFLLAIVIVLLFLYSVSPWDPQFLRKKDMRIICIGVVIMEVVEMGVVKKGMT